MEKYKKELAKWLNSFEKSINRFKIDQLKGIVEMENRANNNNNLNSDGKTKEQLVDMIIRSAFKRKLVLDKYLKHYKNTRAQEKQLLKKYGIDNDYENFHEATKNIQCPIDKFLVTQYMYKYVNENGEITDTRV